MEGSPETNKLANKADLIVHIGTRLTDFATASQSIFQNPNVKFASINVSEFDGIKQGATTIVADAKLAWQKLLDLESRPGRRVIFGHSLGGAVAVALAGELVQEVYGGLILESTFSSLHDLARQHSWFAASVLC